MDKETTLKELADAKQAHVKWVKRAKSLIDGFPIEKESIPIESTHCQFGKWFYSEGLKLNVFPNMNSLGIIEDLHKELHIIYSKIFQLYFEKENKSFIGKMFGSKKKISEEEKAKAKEYYSELEVISKKLLNEIARVERRLYAIPLESFKDR